MLKPYMFHNLIEAGCDEAGRGCLADQLRQKVILPKRFRHDVLNDSKPPKNREISLRMRSLKVQLHGMRSSAILRLMN